MARPDDLQFALGHGYYGAAPVTEVTPSLIPDPPSSYQNFDYRIPEGERVTVFTGSHPASFLLGPATGSRRDHTIVCAGTGALTLNAGINGFISGSQTYSVAQGCSISVLDFLPGNWVGTASIVPVVVVVSGHTVADTDITLTGTVNQNVSYSSLSADRTVTMPPASSAGQVVTVQDSSGSCAWGKQIIIAAAGGDKIHGSSATSIRIWVAFGAVSLQSDGSGKWFIIVRAPKTWYNRFTSTAAYTPDPDAVVHRVIGQACGASGGNASGLGGGGGAGAGNVGEWEGKLPVGVSVPITIGSPGAARAIGAGLDGQDGGDVSFGSYLTCYGGKGGKYAAAGPGNGGNFGDPQPITSLELLRSRFVGLASSSYGFSALQKGVSALGCGGVGSDGGANPAVAGSGNIFSATYPGGAAGSDANSCAGGGGGASSPFGAGGKGGERPVAGQPVIAGADGGGFGSGGGGAAVTSLNVDGPSGAGAPGMIDMWVFF